MLPNEDYEFEEKVPDPGHWTLNSLAMCKSVPDCEKPHADYFIKRAFAAADLPLNMAAAKARLLHDPMDKLEDYDDMFITMPKPSSVAIWRSNKAFAEQRLSGAHPNWLKRLSKEADPDVATVDATLKKEFPFDLATVDATLKLQFGTPADIADAKANLLVTDYREVLKDLPRGTWAGRPKYMPVSVGLFVWRATLSADRGELVPVAIAVLDHEDQWRTVTPFTHNLISAGPKQVRTAWALAKLLLQVADANVHEMWSHLYGAHFAMEPVAVATGRWLSGEHPVGQVLRPHLRVLLFNNDIGKQRLVNVDGFVDKLLASSLSGSLEVVRRAAAAYDFTRSSFREDLKARGVDDVTRLPHYPFRDDGLLLLDAIERFVDAHVDGAYPEETAKSQTAKIAEDGRLVRWWAALSNEKECKFRGVPDLSPASLRAVLAHVIFTSGPYHAAVNFPQYDYFAFCPNQPLAAYGPWPAELPADPDEALLAVLPPFAQAIGQVQAVDFLANHRTERLGRYLAKTWTKPYQDAAAAQFLADLDDVERKIDIRNKTREWPYIFLKPSMVPNSTSV